MRTIVEDISATASDTSPPRRFSISSADRQLVMTVQGRPVATVAARLTRCDLPEPASWA